MPVEMAMWKMTSDGPLAIAPKKLNFEDRLEENPHEVRRLHRRAGR